MPVDAMLDAAADTERLDVLRAPAAVRQPDRQGRCLTHGGVLAGRVFIVTCVHDNTDQQMQQTDDATQNLKAKLRA